MLDRFSQTVEKLYSAAGDFTRWDDALRAVETLTGSAGAVVDLVPRVKTVAPKTIAGSFGIAECATYARDYMSICRRIRFGLENPEGTQYDYLHITEAEMDRDPVYDWFGTYGLRYYVGSWAGETPNYNATFSLQRSRQQGHASDEDVALFDLLKPHAARAMSLADQIGSLHLKQRISTPIIESIPQALFALGQDGRILYANSAAEALVMKGDGIRVVDGRLQTCIAGEQDKLDRLIAEAGDVEIIVANGWTKASRPSGAAPYAVFVAPLPADNELLLGMTARVVVIIHDPMAKPAPDARMLIAVYDLTESEARLAVAIAQGHSLESGAALYGIQVATARSHLKAIFAKLGVHRQQDVVRLITSLSSIRV